MPSENLKYELSLNTRQSNGQIKSLLCGGRELLQLGIPKGQSRYLSALWSTHLPAAEAVGEVIGSYVTLRRNLSIPRGFNSWPKLQNGNPIAEPCSVEFITDIDSDRETVEAFSPYLDQGERLEDLPVQFKQAELPPGFEVAWVQTPYGCYRFRRGQKGGVVTMTANYFTPMEMAKLFFATTSADIPQDIVGLAQFLEEPMSDLPKLPVLH